MKGFEAVELVEPKLKARDWRAARRELDELREPDPDRPGHTIIKAERVVERAKDPKSALHGHFTWDVEAAAYQHWLTQAEGLIRRITVVDPNDPTETPVRKYVSLLSDRQKAGGGYRETAEVLSNEELMAELEATAKRDIESVLRRYEPLTDLCARVRKAAGIKPKAGAKALPKKG